MKHFSIFCLYVLFSFIIFSCDNNNPGNTPFYIGDWIPDYGIFELYDSTNSLISSDTMEWGADSTTEAFISFSNTLFSEYLYYPDDTVYYYGSFSYSMEYNKLTVPFLDSVMNEQGYYSSISYFIEEVDSYLLFSSIGIIKPEYVDDFGFSKYMSYNYYNSYSGAIPPSNWPDKGLPITDIMLKNKKYCYSKIVF